MQTEMAVGRPDTGKEQSALPTSTEENKMMSATKYFSDRNGLDLNKGAKAAAEMGGRMFTC